MLYCYNAIIVLRIIGFPGFAICSSLCVVLQVESEVQRDNTSQPTTPNSNLVTSRKHTGKVGSDSRPKLQSKSGVRTTKSTSQVQAQTRLQPSTDSAVVSSTTLQELNTDLTSRSVTGRTIAASKKQITNYKPAHHSAPFKTMPLPPGQSKLPPVSRPGSRKTPSVCPRQSTEASRIDRHGGKVSVAGSAASRSKEIRRIVIDGGRASVTGLSGVSENVPSSSAGGNSPSNVASGSGVSPGGTVELAVDDNRASLDIAVGVRTDMASCRGIPDSGGISGDVTTWAEASRGPTTKLSQSDNGYSLVAASAMVDQHVVSKSATGTAATDVPRTSKAVVQSQTMKWQDENMLRSQQNVAEDSTSSFSLHRDGQVEFVTEFIAVLLFAAFIMATYQLCWVQAVIYVAAKATYIRLLFGKMGVFRP